MTVPDIAQVILLLPQLVALDIAYVGHGDDWCTLALPYTPQAVGFPENGVVSNGAIFTLMDTAAGMAVLAVQPFYQPIATLDLRLDYLRPATAGLTVLGRAQCYKLTRRVAFVRGIAYHDDPNAPIAHISGTFALSEEGRAS